MGEEGREGGLRQETQGCWHVLFFHYVISIPMQSALIFDELSAQHPPLSPSHPIPSQPILSLPLSLSLTGFFTHICKLAFLYAALLCFGASVSPPLTLVSLSK